MRCTVAHIVALAILQEADELIFDPVSSDMDQLDLLAEALSDRLADRLAAQRAA